MDARYSCLTLATGLEGLGSFGLDVESFAELVPVSAAPALQLQLRPDHVVGRAGVDRDAGHGSWQHEILQAFCLLDDIFTGQIIAALLQDLLEDHTLLIAGQIIGIPDIRPRQILREESAKVLHSRIVVPFRIGWILDECPDDHSNGVIKSSLLKGCRYRTRWKIDDQRRLPSNLGYLANRLSREFRGARDQQRLGARGL